MCVCQLMLLSVCLSVCVCAYLCLCVYMCTRTLKGSSAVPIGEPFEEPFLVADRTLLVLLRTLSTEGFTWNQKLSSYVEEKF